MRFKSTVLAAALCAGAVLTSSAVNAATVYDIHAVGTATGHTLAAGVIYYGAPIIIDASFEPSRGTRTTTSLYDDVRGSGATAPLDADVSLDFLSGPDWGALFSSVSFVNGPASSSLQLSLLDPTNQYAMYLFVSQQLGTFPSLDAVPLGGNFCAGAFACFGGIIDPDGSRTLSDVSFAFTSVSITARDVSAIPEPATWAMMIVGFGLVGSTLRASSGRRLAA